jgi:hypothetical protein
MDAPLSRFAPNLADALRARALGVGHTSGAVAAALATFALTAGRGLFSVDTISILGVRTDGAAKGDWILFSFVDINTETPVANGFHRPAAGGNIVALNGGGGKVPVAWQKADSGDIVANAPASNGSISAAPVPTWVIDNAAHTVAITAHGIAVTEIDWIAFGGAVAVVDWPG